jgi:hypothetical protein
MSCSYESKKRFNMKDVDRSKMLEPIPDIVDPIQAEKLLAAAELHSVYAEYSETGEADQVSVLLMPDTTAKADGVKRTVPILTDLLEEVDSIRATMSDGQQEDKQGIEHTGRLAYKRAVPEFVDPVTAAVVRSAGRIIGVPVTVSAVAVQTGKVSVTTLADTMQERERLHMAVSSVTKFIKKVDTVRAKISGGRQAGNQTGK